MRTLALAAAFAVALPCWATAQKNARAPAARVYVFTATTGSAPSTDLSERQDAVKELRNALAKKKGISIVDDQGDAEIKIEVIRCETVDMGGGGFGGKELTPLDEKVIHVHAVSSADQADFKGTAPGYWSRAAKDAADRLSKWIERQPKDASHAN